MATSKVPKTSRDEVVRQRNASSGTEEEEEGSDPGYDSSNESDSGEEDQDSCKLRPRAFLFIFPLNELP